jgi:hypothetical protein
VASVELARAAVEELDRLIVALSLPADTRDRLRRRSSSGKSPSGSGFRFLLGPWRWMICVYVHFPQSDRVVIVTIQDAWSSTAATART